MLMNANLLQDYYNLVDVYLDAVLQPRCVTDPKTFAQEGWHYELDDAKVSPMQLRCVVNALKAGSEHLDITCSFQSVSAYYCSFPPKFQ